MIMCNTNNGTERLNKELKYQYLDENKSTLSTLLEELIFKFIPTLQQTYLELNVK